MVRVVIAPDKFKGSLTATEAARAMARAVLTIDPSAIVDWVPMAVEWSSWRAPHGGA